MSHIIVHLNLYLNNFQTEKGPDGLFFYILIYKIFIIVIIITKLNHTDI